MGTATEKEKSGRLSFGSWIGSDISTIRFCGPARYFKEFLKTLAEEFGSPKFGWNGEYYDEN